MCGTLYERVDGVPTQLPLEIVRRVMCGLTRPGDFVVDPFTGSGTTAVICVKQGRRFHGFELREEFASIARRRAADAAATPPAQHSAVVGK